MAASPIAQLPWIRTLSLTVHLDSHFRAADGAQRTAGALTAFLADNGVIALGVHLGCRDDQGLLAGMNAQMALLAKLPVNDDAGFHHFSSFLRCRGSSSCE